MTITAIDRAHASKVELALVVQSAQSAPLVELLSITAANQAHRASEPLLSPMGLTEPLRVHRVPTTADDAIGATTQELSVMAPAQAPPFRLLTTVGLGTHD